MMIRFAGVFSNIPIKARISLKETVERIAQTPNEGKKYNTCINTPVDTEAGIVWITPVDSQNSTHRLKAEGACDELKRHFKSRFNLIPGKDYTFVA